MQIRNILRETATVGGFVLEAWLIKKYEAQKVKVLQNRVNVLSDHFQLLNHWLEIKNEGKSAASYFEYMNYRHIAQYGMAELANRLLDDLAGSNIIVDYGIDRDVSCTIGRISEIYSLEDDLPETELIVVTPYSSFESIKEILKKKTSCQMISLEEIIWSV